MSRSRRILHGLGFFYAGQVVILLVGLWTTRFVLDTVGKADYGLWLIGQQILTYLALTEFGLIGIVPRAIGKLTGQGGEDPAAGVQEYVHRTVQLVVYLLPVVAGAAGLVWYLLPREWVPLREPLGIVLIGFTLLFPLRLLGAVLSGAQDLWFISFVGTTSWCVGAGVNVGLLLAGMGLESLAWGWIALQGTTALCYGVRLWRKFPEYVPKRLARLRWQDVRPQLGEAMWANLHALAVALCSATDMFLIGTLLGPETVVPYACTLRLIQTLGTNAQAALSMSLPGLAEARETETPERLRGICTSLIASQLLVTGAVVCVLLAVNGMFVAFWLEDLQFFGGTELNALLLLNLLLRHLNTTFLSCLFALGHNRLIPLVSIADGVINVAGCLLLLPWLGPIGVPLASSGALLLLALPISLVALAGSFETSPVRLLLPLRGWLIRFALVAAGAAAVARLIPTADLGRTELLAALVAGAAGVGLAYGVLMLPVLRLTPLGRLVDPILARVLRLLPLGAGRLPE